jgi:hypothetical protein
MARRLALAILCLCTAQHLAAAFPNIFVDRYAQDCTDHPTADYGKVHEYQRTPDK